MGHGQAKVLQTVGLAYSTLSPPKGANQQVCTLRGVLHDLVGAPVVSGQICFLFYPFCSAPLFIYFTTKPDLFCLNFFQRKKGVISYT